MKRISVLLLAGWSLTGIVCAQSKKNDKNCTGVPAPKMIRIDFFRKTEPVIKIKGIKKGDFYTVRIDSINLNLFKVMVNTKDTISGKALETPVFGNFNLDALSKLVSGLSPLSTSIAQPSPPAFKVDPKKYLVLVEEMNKYLNSLRGYIKNAIDHSRSIDSVKMTVYETRLNSLKLNGKLTSGRYEILLKRLVNIRDGISFIQTNLIESRINYDNFFINNSKIIMADTSLSLKDKEIKGSYEKLTSGVSDALSAVSADKVNELLTPLVLIENNVSNTYTSLPIQFTGDQAKVKISVVPRDEKLNLQSYTTEIIFPISKWYTDIGISYYGSSLHDEPYTVVESISASDTVYNVRKESGVDFEMGLAALLRFGKKLGENKKVGLHGSLGAGISISDKIKPRFFTGAGISFGVRHMIAVDGGLISGYADRISDGADTSTSYQFKPATVTVSKPGFGFFGAIGYIYHF